MPIGLPARVFVGAPSGICAGLSVVRPVFRKLPEQRGHCRCSTDVVAVRFKSATDPGWQWLQRTPSVDA